MPPSETETGASQASSPTGTFDSPSLAASRLVPPRGERRLMPRDALMDRLADARQQRCVVVQGPAGSGKTCTLLAWRKQLLGLDTDVAWLTLTPAENDPSRFVDSVLASFAEIDGKIVHDAARLAGRDSDEAACERLMLALLAGVGRHPRGVVLMLDDVQHLRDPFIVEALHCLTEYAPPNLRLAFATRAALPLSLAALNGQGQVLEIGMRDLAFSAAESERYLRDHVSDIDKREARRLHELTEGWVAGLQLVAVNLKTQRRQRGASVPVRDAQAFAKYFEQEVLAGLPAEDLELLTRISACQSVTPSLCATLMGTPRAVARMTRHLMQIEGSSLFLSGHGTPGQEVWYRLHPLMREVLQARWQDWPDAERRTVHATAWRWFEARGHLDEAVHHAVQAGESDAAAELVEQGVPELLERSNMAQIAALVRLLPPDQVRRRFRLRNFRAYLRLYAHDFEAVTETLEELDQEAARGELDVHQRFSVTLLRASLALYSDDVDALTTLLPQVRDAPDGLDQMEAATRANLLGMMYVFSGDYANSRRVLQEESWADKSIRSGLIADCVTAMSLMLEGQMARAGTILRHALETAETSGPAYVGVACLATGLLAEILYELNDIETLCSLLESRIDVLERVSMPDTVLRALAALAVGQWAAHRPLDAHAALERLEDYALRNRTDRLLAYVLVIRVRAYLQEGEPDFAEGSLDRLDAIAAQHGESPHSMMLDVQLCAGRGHLDLCMHRNDYFQMRDRAYALLALAEPAGRWRFVACLYMQLAVAEQHCGNPASAETHLLEALRLGHRLGLLRTLIDASPQVPALLEALQQREGLDPVLGFYLQRLVDAASRPQASAVAAPARPLLREALSERESEILELVAQAMPNKKIAAMLNITPETVKWHLKNIFNKLEVGSRNDAAARLRALKAESRG